MWSDWAQGQISEVKAASHGFGAALEPVSVLSVWSDWAQGQISEVKAASHGFGAALEPVSVISVE